MHTDSSASFTYLASLSASECTATVLMPMSRQARWMRRAISPRLAIRTFSNIAGEPCASLDHHQRGAVFHWLGVFNTDPQQFAGAGRADLVHDLHRLDDQQGL